MKLLRLFSILFGFLFSQLNAQDVALYSQHYGTIDFTFAGNTLNKMFNNLNTPCEINTSSSATLNLNEEDELLHAYLYWAGSGTGDFDVKLNETEITAERSFDFYLNTVNLDFFSAFADVTSLVKQQGNGIYTFSDFDLNSVIPAYCPTGTNFGGWALLLIYKNSNLPLNQINVYDGLQGVPNALSISLNNLNVVETDGAKVGFIAWEGDVAIAVSETLTFNNNIVSNPPLNPENNAFNGTNSITGDTDLYNMDLDIYSIEELVNIGDTSAEISLTSGQDFVMINTVVTKLNTKPEPPVIFNAISDNGDGKNDGFIITGLRDVFKDFELKIFNRYGHLVWEGNNNTPDWDGSSINGIGKDKVPPGTYFYTLKLNSIHYPEPYAGYVYYTN